MEQKGFYSLPGQSLSPPHHRTPQACGKALIKIGEQMDNTWGVGNGRENFLFLEIGNGMSSTKEHGI